MALATYTPAYGAHSGSAYTLPLVTADERSLVFSGSAARAVAEGWGSILASGKAPQFPSGALIDVTLTFTPNALINRSYAGNITGLEIALIDFSEYIFDGGDGTLRENLPTGMTDGTLGASITYRTTSAIVNGSPKVRRQLGSDVCEIDVQFFCKSAFWQDSAGNLRLIV